MTPLQAIGIIISLFWGAILCKTIGNETNHSICHQSATVIDPTRPSHRIPLLLYYPCDSTLQYPFMVFGHASESQATWYDYIWQGLVPQGYICVFLGSHQYIPNELDFARDQRYINDWMRDDPECPLRDIVFPLSIASGMSMGGGSSMISSSEDILQETFNHTFDALMTLSGCGHGQTTHRAMSQMKVATFVMSGSHDCICPAVNYADLYYEEIPQSTCKYLAVIRNATHCHFGEEGTLEDEACELTERVQCNDIPYQHIAEKDQHSIVVQYYSLFMKATLSAVDSDHVRDDAVAEQLRKDFNDGVMSNIAIHC